MEKIIEQISRNWILFIISFDSFMICMVFGITFYT